LGPSTGLPTRTAQGDIGFCYNLSHGDTRHVCLIPSSVEECFEYGWRAFDLAERLQTPVFILSDLDLGMNIWMSEPFQYPEQPMDRGKVLTADDLERLGDGFRRYADDDGTGIPPRTLPYTPHSSAGLLTRGSGHNADGQYSEDPDDYHYMMERLRRKHGHARVLVPAPEVDVQAGAEVGILAFGSTHGVIREARDLLTARGVATSYYLLKALHPYSKHSSTEEGIRQTWRVSPWDKL